MKKRISIFCTVLLLCLMLLGITPTFAVQNDVQSHPKADLSTARQIIRIGWPIQGKLAYVDAAGMPAGYTYEYLMRVRQFMGWDYDFEVFDGTNGDRLISMLNKLNKGEIQLMGGLSGSDAAASLYGYKLAADSYCDSYTTLAAKADNNKLYNITDLTRSKIKIAVFGKGGSRREAMINFCNGLGMDYEIVQYENEKETIDAVFNDEADVISVTDFMVNDTFRSIAKFLYEPLYFGITPQNPDLLRDLNHAVSEIDLSSPGFKNELYRKYFELQLDKLLLTEEETAFVAESAAIPVRIVPNAPPFQYADKNGNIKGITRELLDRISQKSGLKFTYQIETTEGLLQRNLPKNQIIGSLPYDYLLATQMDVRMTTPYVSVPMLTMANKKSAAKAPEDAKVAIASFSNAKELTLFGSTVVYPDAKACIDATYKGETDFVYANAYAFSYYGQNANFKNLVSVPGIYQNSDFCLAVSEKSDLALFSILNKTLRTMSTGEIAALVSSSTGNYSEKISLKAFIASYPIETVLLMVCAFVLLTGLVTLLFMIRIKSNKRLVIDAKRYAQLSELSGEFIAEYDYAGDRLMLTKPFAEMFDFPVEIANYSKTPLFKNFQDIKKDLHGGKEMYLEVAGGEKRWFRMIYSVIEDGGKPVSMLCKLTDIQHEKTEKDALYQKAITDALTGLHNIGHFKSETAERLTVSNGAFFIFDLDDFKGINDTYGHLEGDRILASLAIKLKFSFTRPARLGGDEFVVFEEGLDAATAKLRAKKVLASVKKIPLSGRIVKASCGISICNAGAGYADAYRLADEALYCVKAEKGDGVAVNETTAGDGQVSANTHNDL